MDMVGLDGERQYLPAFLSALAFQQFTAPRRYRSNEHRLPAARTPDEVIDDAVNAMFVSLVFVFALCRIHGLVDTTN